MKPVALVCIAKDEDRYIEEWCQYHLKLGFDRIFIYQNDWRCSLENPLITKIDWDGKHCQRPAYNNFLQSYHRQYSWCAFFDVDEFLVLKQHGSVKELLNNYKEFNAVSIPWVLFGQTVSDCSEAAQTGVLKRFIHSRSCGEQMGKVFVKVNKSISMGVHNPVSCRTTTLGRERYSGPRLPDTSTAIAQLNHYFCKTPEEFQHKLRRGRFSRLHPFRDPAEFHTHDHNDIVDTSARQFLYGY